MTGNGRMLPILTNLFNDRYCSCLDERADTVSRTHPGTAFGRELTHVPLLSITKPGDNPVLQQLYPGAGVTTGILITLISLVGALFRFIAGVFAGQVGAHGVLPGGLIVGVLVSLVQSIDLPLSLLLASRVVEGGSHLAIVVAAPMLIALYSSDRLRALAMISKY